MRWTARIMVVTLLLAFVQEASAQPAPTVKPSLLVFTAELHVDLGPGTERCPDATPYLRRLIADEMGYDPFAGDGTGRPAGRFGVTVVRIPSGLRATNEHTGAGGEARWTKTYQDVTTTRGACESVLKGVALQIVAELTRFQEPPRAAACPAPTPCPSCPAPMPCLDSRFSIWPTEWPMPPLRAPAPDPPKPLERWPFAVRLGVAAWPELIVSGLGSIGVSAEIGVRYRAVSLGVEVHGDPPIGSLTYPSGIAVNVARVSGALLVCGHYGWFVGCAVGDVGRFIFPDHVPALPASARYGAAGVRVGLEFPVAPPWLFIQTMIDVRAPIDPAGFMFAHVPVFEVAGPSVGLGLGLRVELPAARASGAGAPVASR